MKEAVEEKWKDRKENCRKQEKKKQGGIKGSKQEGRNRGGKEGE